MKKVLCLFLCIITLVSAVCMPVSAATNTFEKTDDLCQNMINAALAQKGKKNKDFRDDGMPADEWCAYFIIWLSRVSGAGQAGILPQKYSGNGTVGILADHTLDLGKGTLFCFRQKTYDYVVDTYGGKNTVMDASKSYNPQPGDLIYFCSSSSTARFGTHVGLVYKVSGSTVYYVDGNGSGRADGSYATSYVDTHTVKKTHKEVVAYLHIDYGTASTKDSVSFTTKVNPYTYGANLEGSAISYTGTRPTSYGGYLGTSKDNMRVQFSTDMGGTANPYKLNDSLINLEHNTTYYLQLFAVVNGETIKDSTIHTFTTPKDTKTISVQTEIECGYRITVPANQKVYLYSSPTSKDKYYSIAPRDSQYTIFCTKRLFMSDSTVRYYYVDSQGRDMYLRFLQGMTSDVVHDYGNTAVTAATCSDFGYVERICACGDSYISELVLPLGHEYENGACIRCGEAEPKPDVLLGDANNDGEIDFSDAVLVLEYSTFLIDDSQIDLSACDVNGDGFVDFSDAVLILEYSAFLITEFPAAK